MIRMKYPHNMAIYWPYLMNVCANGAISVARSDIADQRAKSRRMCEQPARGQLIEDAKEDAQTF